ncbi:MAG: hypothetical protein MJ177_07015 [Clostridia bacterium]|nr:hypothetical protein [Clostridia bacterium]
MKLVNAKKLAKHRISEKNAATFAGVLICRLLLALCGFLPLVFSFLLKKIGIFGSQLPAYAAALVFAAVICSALRLGREKYFFSLAENGICSFRMLFFFFSPRRLFRAVRCWCFFYFMRLGRAAIMLSPFAVSVAVTLGLLKKGVLSVQMLFVLAALCAVLMLCGIIFFTVINSGDLLFFRYVTDNSGLSAVDAMKKSREHMKRHLKKAAAFRMSFMPRMLLCAFIIPGVFSYRYYKESCCIYLTVVDGNGKFC